MSAVNQFLREFVEMRKNISPVGKIVGNPQPANPSAKKRKEKFAKQQETLTTSLAKILEEKPGKKELIAFLQNRANDLSTEKMTT
jgi:predicted ArsR family transcriptional regulator